jgi:hypothetical protein
MFGYNLWDVLVHIVPWWVQLALAVGVLAALFLLAVKVFGWERVRPFVLPAFAVVGAGVLLSRARQKGWQDKIAADIKAADKLIATATKARAEAERKQREHPEDLRDDDGFRRD